MGGAMGKNGVNFLDALPSQGTLHIVMLGLDSAGKTTALYRLKFDQYLNTVPTIGFNCEKVQGILGRAKGIQFLVWDVGGQEKLRPLWRSYTRIVGDSIVAVTTDSISISCRAGYRIVIHLLSCMWLLLGEKNSVCMQHLFLNSAFPFNATAQCAWLCYVVFVFILFIKKI
ncbi:ADP-ribosylation factor-like protein 4A isoform X1 [Bactrocera tryoni]|uniref:ADP-ribosylation factor-like protein 4A isoform X1 n=1 Tax=Bactrocera tryoni TaxID=59916 RepID=UPI001A960A90|nr:ADP-ribosylation factor-like protein 4A isoform X1 [Bactrocera tryoni]XP_039967989.1 ADP-ribosylation factor-like protein 4A isoform X1 [Bactrocera tryoni]